MMEYPNKKITVKINKKITVKIERQNSSGMSIVTTKILLEQLHTRFGKKTGIPGE